MEYILTQNQVFTIIQRFRNKFSYRRKPDRNHTKKYNITENNIIFSKAYVKQCKYAKEIGLVLRIICNNIIMGIYLEGNANRNY